MVDTSSGRSKKTVIRKQQTSSGSWMDQLGIGPNKYDKQGVPRVRQGTDAESSAVASHIKTERARRNAPGATSTHGGPGFNTTAKAPTPVTPPVQTPSKRPAPRSKPAVAAKKTTVATAPRTVAKPKYATSLGDSRNTYTTSGPKSWGAAETISRNSSAMKNPKNPTRKKSTSLSSLKWFK